MKRFSIIIISRNEADASAANEALRRLQYDVSEIEVIQAIGFNPSLQRNEAAKLATGEFLLFLDEDSLVHSKLLQYYNDALSYDEDIGVVGGPSLFEPQRGNFQMAVQAFFESAFGLGPFRARYSSQGAVRPCSEKELILCNILVRRSLFLEEGGFHLDLYPNEENEFLNRVQERTKIFYHPLAVCYREAPNSFFLFVKQMIRYGLGRAKHLRLFPQFWSFIFFIPALFFLYVLLIPIVAIYFPHFLLLYMTLFLLHALLSLSAAVYAYLQRGSCRIILFMPIIIFFGHFFYGMGFFIGMILHPLLPEAPRGKVETIRRKEFDILWD